MIKWIFTDSCGGFFKSFYEGFHKVCQGEILSVFEPEELELLICGSTILDFDALEKVTIYQDGYTENSATV